MPRRVTLAPDQITHRWYLREWAAYRGLIQADAQRDLGWSKATTSEMFNGIYRYHRDHIEQASKWLNIQPFELLLPPAEALAIRQLRESARAITSGFAFAAEDGQPFASNE